MTVLLLYIGIKYPETDAFTVLVVIGTFWCCYLDGVIAGRKK
jgi:hypothetical protein